LKPPGEGLISLSDNVGGVKFFLERTSAFAFEKAQLRSSGPHLMLCQRRSLRTWDNVSEARAGTLA